MPPETITTVAPTAMMAKKLASVAVWTSVYQFRKLLTTRPDRGSTCDPAASVSTVPSARITSTRPACGDARTRCSISESRAYARSAPRRAMPDAERGEGAPRATAREVRRGEAPGLSEPADQQLAFVDHLGRQMVVQVDEELFVLDHFAAPRRADRRPGAPRTARARTAGPSSRCPRSAASSRSTSRARACGRARDRRSTSGCACSRGSPATGTCPSASLRNQFTWNTFGVSESDRCIRIQCRK